MALKNEGFAVCLVNEGFEVSLEVRKLYPVVRDPQIADHLIRVVDESGDDYLYPAKFFRKLSLPAELERVLRKAS